MKIFGDFRNFGNFKNSMNSGNCRNSENIWDSLGISGNLWELGNLVKINKSVHREMYQKWKNENKIGDFRDFVSCFPVKVIVISVMFKF